MRIFKYTCKLNKNLFKLKEPCEQTLFCVQNLKVSKSGFEELKTLPGIFLINALCKMQVYQFLDTTLNFYTHNLLFIQEIEYLPQTLIFKSFYLFNPVA